MATVDVTRIASNIGALNSLYALQNVNSTLAAHQSRLATGRRIMSGADDVSISSSSIVRQQALKDSLTGTSDAKNVMTTAGDGLMKVQGLLLKMRSTVEEAKAETVDTDERDALSRQLQGFRDEIDTIVQQTQWKGAPLLAGADGAGKSTPLPVLTDAAEGLTFSFANNQGFSASAGTNDGSSVSAEGLGLDDQGLRLAAPDQAGETTNSADTVSNRLDAALNTVATGLAQVGAFTARLTIKEEAFAVQRVNTEAAYSRIMNASMAEETLELSRQTILQQTATAMLAQANTAPQMLLQLFR